MLGIILSHYILHYQLSPLGEWTTELVSQFTAWGFTALAAQEMNAYALQVTNHNCQNPPSHSNCDGNGDPLIKPHGSSPWKIEKPESDDKAHTIYIYFTLI